MGGGGRGDKDSCMNMSDNSSKAKLIPYMTMLLKGLNVVFFSMHNVCFVLNTL